MTHLNKSEQVLGQMKRASDPVDWHNDCTNIRESQTKAVQANRVVKILLSLQGGVCLLDYCDWSDSSTEKDSIFTICNTYCWKLPENLVNVKGHWCHKDTIPVIGGGADEDDDIDLLNENMSQASLDAVPPKVYTEDTFGQDSDVIATWFKQKFVEEEKGFNDLQPQEQLVTLGEKIADDFNTGNEEIMKVQFGDDPTKGKLVININESNNELGALMRGLMEFAKRYPAAVIWPTRFKYNSNDGVTVNAGGPTTSGTTAVWGIFQERLCMVDPVTGYAYLKNVANLAGFNVYYECSKFAISQAFDNENKGDTPVLAPFYGELMAKIPSQFESFYKELQRGNRAVVKQLFQGVFDANVFEALQDTSPDHFCHGFPDCMLSCEAEVGADWSRLHSPQCFKSNPHLKLAAQRFGIEHDEFNDCATPRQFTKKLVDHVFFDNFECNQQWFLGSYHCIKTLLPRCLWTGFVNQYIITNDLLPTAELLKENLSVVDFPFKPQLKQLFDEQGPEFAAQLLMFAVGKRRIPSNGSLDIVCEVIETNSNQLITAAVCLHTIQVPTRINASTFKQELIRSVSHSNSSFGAIDNV